MFDKIEKIDHSLVQHGPNNDRIYLMKLDQRDVPGIIERLDDISIAKRYTKIFAKVPDFALPAFLKNEYKKEATIPKLKKGKEDIHFVSKFFGSRRSFVSRRDEKQLRKNLDIALEKRASNHLKPPENFTIRQLDNSDAIELASVYKKVFKVYPFPIFDKAYLEQTMEQHIRYFGAFIKDKLVAASSAEMDQEMANAEMTDFATLPRYLGKNISFFLLKEMEKAMSELKMATVYTIARAESIGMNATFARSGYEFAGRLVNNTMIGERIESMNVWYKSLH